MSIPASRTPTRPTKRVACYFARFLFLASGLLLALPCLVTGADTNAWQRTDAYAPPDFEHYFPDDPESGRRLDAIVKAGQLSTLPPDEAIAATRQGFRTAQRSALPILREFGNRFIWGKSPQNPAAVELMYHAAGYARQADPNSTRHYAIYFGLSVVEPKPPNVLRTLADLAVAADDPNILSRVAWGVRSQRDACLAFLEPHLNSTTNAVREHATIVRRILRNELEAFAWARERDRKQARAEHSGDLPAVRRVLAEGSSTERRQVFQSIDLNHLALIMDDTFLPAFANCARDGDQRVRSLVARVVGENWIWQAREQSPEAIQLLLKLSRDHDRQVRHEAVYFGLSTVRAKSDEVIEQLVQLALAEEEDYYAGRIKWGLAADLGKVTTMLAEYEDDANPQKAAKARKLRQDWLAAGSKENPAAAVKTPGQPDWRALLRQRLSVDFQPFQIQLTDADPVNIRRREVIALGDQVLVVMEAGDRLRTIEFVKVSGLQDLPKRR